MGDQDDGQLQLLVDLRQQLQHRGGGLRIEGAGRLVAEQDRRPAGQGAGDTDALLLPAGKLCRVLARLLGEADAGQQLGDAGVDFTGAAATGQAQRHGDVVGDGLRGEQVEVLEDHADALAEATQAVGVEGGDVFAIDDDAPATGLFQAVDQTKQGTFAGAGMADEAEHLATFDGQAGRLQGRNIAAGDAIGLVDVVEFDHVTNLVGAKSCQLPTNSWQRA
ncbi:hypothetical protein D9M71_586870 [compost metagenome]